ncbi:ornithine--oxo-acid aminotransferase [Candidatus Tenderia electrophaga]|jgi:ornithine--oxo-acid transaminase|uniref:ornithine aminotransferase n=1 Tax=Candidatus Tenderia electrophaga TaxID=1748243 RepID=A0A0S2THA4_9GAMM|nr:ornithine--oxo-acid aminotransferase [Candidatus Tenderia electrophaga]
MNPTIELEEEYCAHNYLPLPVVLVRGAGVYVWDDAGKRYLDMMSAYSAVSHGHCHPRLVQALTQQAGRLAIVSRAFYSDKLAPLLEQACRMTGQDMALPMNTGAEAVETALKAARKWAYTVKGVPADQAEIIVCDGNFHGRTISIVGFSSEDQYKAGFGPFPPGFTSVPFGDVDALEAAIGPNTAAFLVEPIQGEGGIIVPPPGYLSKVAKVCADNDVLLICDEIQTGLGRTGALLASTHDAVKPDGLILGKALGGGLLPVSMFLARREVMEMFQPGDHGSTFGGNPLSSAVALEGLRVLEDEGMIEAAAEMGAYFMAALGEIKSPLIQQVRGKGLLIGVEFYADKVAARTICERLMDKGILSKETHDTVVRLAPPLIITREQIDATVEALRQVLSELEG